MPHSSGVATQDLHFVHLSLICCIRVFPFSDSFCTSIVLAISSKWDPIGACRIKYLINSCTCAHGCVRNYSSATLVLRRRRRLKFNHSSTVTSCACVRYSDAADPVVDGCVAEIQYVHEEHTPCASVPCLRFFWTCPVSRDGRSLTTVILPFSTMSLSSPFNTSSRSAKMR